MKYGTMKLLGLLGLWLLLTGNCVAADLEALDRVSVHMDRPAVKRLLGAPDAKSELSIGLEADVYNLVGQEPLIGTGCVYSKEDRLVGQAFVFAGSVAPVTVERLKKTASAAWRKKRAPPFSREKMTTPGAPSW